ncbi:heme-binding protein [Microlunatus sp. Gsoil 973]|nr:heme-binding protein [Microlunatus sp. Gsoil 973]
MALRLESANAIIAGAISQARADGIPPLAVVVLDLSGHIVAAQRDDGASMFRFDIARGKAWGAVAMGCSSAALAARAADNPNFFNALGPTSAGRLLPQPGAVLIRDADGSLLGAVGASGGTGAEDAACCAAGVAAAGLVPEK